MCFSLLIQKSKVCDSILHCGTFLVPHGVRELDEFKLDELWTMVAASSRCDLGPIGDVSS